MTGRCLFGFSGEKPFLLPDNEGVKMNTSPVRMDDLPLNRFHCRIAALTFGAHLTDGYVLGVIGYAIIQLTPAMQLTPFMAGMIGGSALLGLFIGSLVLGWISDHIGRQKIFTFSFLLITLASFLQFFATTPEHLIGLRILIPMFYWAMKWQRRPINTSKPCSLRATGGAQRLTASSLSAS